MELLPVNSQPDCAIIIWAGCCGAWGKSFEAWRRPGWAMPDSEVASVEPGICPGLSHQVIAYSELLVSFCHGFITTLTGATAVC